jgi:hypothetical protein
VEHAKREVQAPSSAAGRLAASLSSQRLRAAGFAVGFDTDPALLVNSSLPEGVINIVAVHQPSLVLVTQRHASTGLMLGSSGEAVAARIGRKHVTRRESAELPSASELRPGQLCIAPATSRELLAASDPPAGAALVFVVDS